MTLDDVYLVALADLSDQLPDSATNLIPKHRLAVFGYEYEMVVQPVNGVVAPAIVIHDDSIIPQAP